MPELPEVETVLRGLMPSMDGKVIKHADVRRPDLRWPFPERMSERLSGARITGMTRRSKYMLLALDRGETLIIHLGMSGRMIVSGAPVGEFHHVAPVPLKHDHVVFHMEDGARVAFNDARRFGAMDLALTAELSEHKFIKVLGPEPLGNDFNEPHLNERLAGRRTPIKSALLDQGIVAGLGNIYVCEVLFRTGISPVRLAQDITERDVAKLVPMIRDVLNEAIEAGGSSLKDYRQADGDLGYFQHAFRVYGREGEACVTDGCDGRIERIVQSGRSTFCCLQCQR